MKYILRTSLRLVPWALVTLGALVSARADYSSTVLSDSPAGYWRLGDMAVGQSPVLSTGDAAANTGSGGAALTGYYLYGAAHPVAGALAGSADSAVAFDGWKSRVDVPYQPLLNSTNFTVEMWLNITNPTGNRAVSPLFCRDTNSQRGYLFFANNATTKWQFRTYSGATARNISSTNNVAYNTWTHVVGTHQDIPGVGSVMRFFLNGQEANVALTNTAGSYSPNTAAPLRLGAGNTQNVLADFFWPGSMDEVAIYSNALTPAQILAHYQNGTNASRGTNYETVIAGDGPVAYWRLDEPAAGANLPTPPLSNAGSLGAAANGISLGVTNSAAPVPGVTNNIVGGTAGVLTGDANPAIQFNGKGGMVGVPYNASLNPASFTVECWARQDGWAGAHQSPVSSRNGLNVAYGYILYAAPSGSAAQWQFWTGPGWQSIAGPTVNLGQWYHLVGTYDATTKLKLFYVDGQIVAGATGVSMTPNDLKPLRIGAGENETGGNFFWNGAVDEVAVYPGVLPPARVDAHYEAGKGAAPLATAAPTIPVNPANQTNWAPYAVTLTSVALGSLPMQLQWYHVSVDGSTTTLVPGGTNMTLTINPTAASDSGNYYLAASNSLGTAQSLWAWVEIIPPTAPSFTLGLPATSPVYVNGTAGLDAVAAGTPPLTYLLQSNSVTVAVSTNGSFKIPNVQYAYSNAQYQITATNMFGSLPSSSCQLTVMTAPVSTYAAVTTNLNPAGYWRLGEDSGTTAFDYWGGRNGDYVNSYPNFIPGALLDDDDGCVQEYGSGSYVRMRDPVAFNFNGTTNHFSLVAWVKADSWSTSGSRIFSTRYQVGNTGGFGFGVWAGNSYRFTAYGVTDVAQGLPTLNVGQWYQLAAVCSNLTVYFYLDGVYQGAGNGAIGATGIKTSPYPLQLGGNPNFATASDEEPFNGQIDEAAVYGRVLTGAEIKALHDARYGSLVPPSIVKDTVSVQLFAGGTARFAVEATGSSPLSYQWQSNNVAIPNATNTTLVIPNVTAGMNGSSYLVTVSNRAGATNSSAATLTVLTPSGYASAVVQDAPVALWRLGETPGSQVAYDNLGSHNGAVLGNVSFGTAGALAGDANTAATFDGATPTHVEVPYAPELNTTNFTVECWARVTGGVGAYRSPVSDRNEVQGGNQSGYILYATSGNVWSFWTGAGAGWNALDGPAVTLNEWTHLVATYDGTNKNLYVNGVLVSTAQQTVTPNPIRGPRIGAGQNEVDPGNYFFPGDVDEVAIYGYALPAERVAYHYNLGKYSTTTAPFIVKDPVSATGVAGNTVQLTVTAAGSPTLAYQWQKQGSGNIPGATQSTLTLSNVYYTDAGSYRAVITNGVGATNSAYAQLVVLPPPSYANQTQDLVLHLAFDGNANDTSGRGNNGTEIGGPTYVPGKIGTQAIKLSTTTASNLFSYVTLGTYPDLSFGVSNSFSVSFWINFTTWNNDLPMIGNSINSTYQLGWVFANEGGKIELSLASTANSGTYVADPVAGSPVINDGQWHHVVGVVDRALMIASVYVDGGFAGSWSINGLDTLDYGYSLTIGQDPTGVYGVDGTAAFDDVGIWRRALTGYDALSIYNAAQNGLSFDNTGPVKLYLNSNGGNFDLSWQAGTLLQSTNVTGPYLPVAGATAPFYRTSPTNSATFFRVQQ